MSVSVLWMIAGVALCIMEFIIPTAFVELTMGLSAIAVALLTPVIPHLGLQVVLWLALSVLLNILLQRFLPKTRSRVIEDSKEAKTLTEILPGQTGRVIYEGNSWQARCEDEEIAIAPHQKVYVVRRQGTTLIVMPEQALRF
ncbi:MAG: NfeD family protein [Drouetiella hepatica Uher 2000/2452]|uniref:NfeD family protein n=1 Tax=Drouetiella hepatica Uher 2000/2452 TaxID=904376 RepID=A0A951QHG5_9CYAN|nr:NfeD family protein [Drouetiella hepatica Uher 2000/2452]